MSQINIRNLSNENDDRSPEIVGVSTFSATSFFVPPKGTTAERPSDCEPGSIRFNTDTANLEYFRGKTLGWSQFELINSNLGGTTEGVGVRGLVFGGGTPSSVDTIDYHNLSSTGTWIDFGNQFAGRYGTTATASRSRAIIFGGHGVQRDVVSFVTIASKGDSVDSGLNLPVDHRYAAGFGNGTRGVVAGSYYPAQTNNISYVDIATLGSSADFGDLTEKRGIMKAVNSSTRGVIGGGYNDSNAPTLTIDFVTIATLGNAIDFGDMVGSSNQSNGGCESSTRGLWSGGYTNIIGFITIATLGNAADFGDTVNPWGHRPAVSSPTRGMWCGGRSPSSPYPSNTDVDYVEIATLGNAKDFGDLSAARQAGSGTSNGHGGL